MQDPFSIAVDAWIDKVQDKNDRVIRLAAQLALARIKELTPVDTGNLRANWTVVRGSKAEALQGGQEPRPENSQQVVLSLRAGDAFTLINPVVYAARVNYGFVGTDSLGRHYDQPGVHMLEQVVTELPDIVNKAIAMVAASG